MVATTFPKRADPMRNASLSAVLGSIALVACGGSPRDALVGTYTRNNTTTLETGGAVKTFQSHTTGNITAGSDDDEVLVPAGGCFLKAKPISDDDFTIGAIQCHSAPG